MNTPLTGGPTPLTDSMLRRISAWPVPVVPRRAPPSASLSLAELVRLLGARERTVTDSELTTLDTREQLRLAQAFGTAGIEHPL